MTEQTQLEQAYPRPLSGAVVKQPPPALIPARAPLVGQYVMLEPQDARKHARDLYNASHHSEKGLQIWDYLAYGPWPDEASFAANMRQQSANFDTLFYAIKPLDSDCYAGQSSFLDINPITGVIEIGHIWFGPDL